MKTIEEKQLLLKVPSSRLSYGVKFLRESWNYEWNQELSVIEVLEDIDKDGYINNTKVYTVEDIKPYLRPMSSMTKEEEDEFVSFTDTMFRFGEDDSLCVLPLDAISWLNKKMFDYRGLIEKGLAIEVTKENNPYKLD